MKKMKEIGKLISFFMIGIVIFIIMLVITSLIPRNLIERTVAESSDILLGETNRLMIHIPYKNLDLMFDNFTDSLMINTAYSIDSTEPLKSVMTAKKDYIKGVTQVVYPDTQEELKSPSKYGEHYEPVSELQDLVNGEAPEAFEYARYWHGYLVFLRPLLVFFNITTIRVILTVILVVLLGTLLSLIVKKLNFVVAIILGISLFGAEFFYMGMSLQGVFIFLISLISSILLMVRFEKMKNFPMFFLGIGMITNFLDFLTVPIITFAIPLTLYFLMLTKEKSLSFKEIFFVFFKNGLAWLLGYVLTWGLKWVLVDLLYNKELILTSIHQVLYRSGSAVNITYPTIIVYTLILFNQNLIKILIGFILITMLISNYKTLENYKNFKKISFNKNSIKELLLRLLPYAIIMLIPCAWYFVVRGHTVNHIFMTYRNIMIFVFAGGIIIEEFFRFIFNKLEKETSLEK